MVSIAFSIKMNVFFITFDVSPLGNPSLIKIPVACLLTPSPVSEFTCSCSGYLHAHDLLPPPGLHLSAAPLGACLGATGNPKVA